MTSAHTFGTMLLTVRNVQSQMFIVRLHFICTTSIPFSLYEAKGVFGLTKSSVIFIELSGKLHKLKFVTEEFDLTSRLLTQVQIDKTLNYLSKNIQQGERASRIRRTEGGIGSSKRLS